MLRPVCEKIEANFVAEKAAANDIKALEELRQHHPDVFLHQLTELAISDNRRLLQIIEDKITKDDRSHYLLMHAISGEREKLQAEYDLVPEHRRLHAKMLVVEGSARGGHLAFAETLIATFPTGFEIEDGDERVSDIMARIAMLRGYAQNKALPHAEKFQLLNGGLHQLMQYLRAQDYDGADCDEFQMYAYEQIITGFYLSGLFQDFNQTLKAMTSLRYISLRCHLARTYDRYQQLPESFNTFKKGEHIKGVMFNNQCSFEDAAQVIETKAQDQEYLKSMRLFAYKYNKDDPFRKAFNPEQMPASPQLK